MPLYNHALGNIQQGESKEDKNVSKDAWMLSNGSYNDFEMINQQCFQALPYGHYNHSDKHFKSKRTNRKMKKYTTGYGFFFREHHGNLQGNNQDITFSEMSKIISSKWRKLNEFQKQVYRDKVHKTAFSSDYGLFFSDNFHSIKTFDANATFGQISTTIAQKWSSLTLRERKAYKTKREKQLNI